MKRSLLLAALLTAIGCGDAPPAQTPPPAPKAAAASSAAPAAPRPPVARADAFEETMFGVKVADPYRWMEDLESPETKTFFKGQADFTRGALDALPGRAKLRARLAELDNLGVEVRGGPWPTADRYFFLKTKPGENTPKLYYRERTGKDEKLLVDADRDAKGDVHQFIDWYYPSVDGKLVAYGVSPGGSEDSTLHVIEVDTGKVRPDAITRTQYASVSWKPDGKSFFYWRRQKPAANAKPDDTFRNTQVYLHALGQDPETEKPVFGSEERRRRARAALDREPEGSAQGWKSSAPARRVRLLWREHRSVLRPDVEGVDRAGRRIRDGARAGRRRVR